MLRRTLACFLSLCLALTSLAIMGCDRRTETNDSSSGQLPRLSVGIQVSPAMTLVMVAKDKGFFDKAGVDVVIKEFTAGKFALQAFLGGSLDVAVCGEVPVTLSTLQGNKFRVITQVVERTINECRVVVRGALPSDTPETYFSAKKRKLVTSFGGGPEFFTHEFLKKHAISQDAVELVSQRPEDMPTALASGSVDAIAIFDPFARIAEVMLGKEGRTFADANIYSELYVVAVREEALLSQRGQLLAFLRGLQEAASFIDAHPEESKAILIRYTRLDKSIVDDIWGNFIFRPALNRLFLDCTTAEAEWSVRKGTFPPGTEIPDFHAILCPDLLREVDASSVVLNN